MDIERIADELGLHRQKVKGDELVASCPLHDDRDPSFSINMDTGMWNCFVSCGGGTLDELVSRILNITRKKAREWLEERGNPMSASRRGAGLLAKERARSKAKKEKPKVQPCSPFDIGHVPTWITERGFEPELLREYQCGMDYSMDAFVIPVIQSHALIYRCNPLRNGPKYRHTEGFKSHNTLYGLHNVKLGKGDSLILVEGPLDCLWLRQNGYENSLAIMGGGTLGMEQRRIIKKDLKPKRVLLAFDNDEAGQHITNKVATALKGIPCYTVQWRKAEHEDEDDLIILSNDVADCSKEQLEVLFKSPELVTPKARKLK